MIQYVYLPQDRGSELKQINSQLVTRFASWKNEIHALPLKDHKESGENTHAHFNLFNAIAWERFQILLPPTSPTRNHK
jgi:hypothetical protein